MTSPREFCVAWGDYHDLVWGTPNVDSVELFGQLMLCTQQCGVSWKVVWNKRHHYREAFHNWDMASVAAMTDVDVDRLCDKAGPWAGKLIQNRGKLSAIVHNARQCLLIHEGTEGGLAAFLWSFVKAPAREFTPSFGMCLPGLAEPVMLSSAAINIHADCECAEYKHAFGVTSEVSDCLAAALKQQGATSDLLGYEKEQGTKNPRKWHLWATAMAKKALAAQGVAFKILIDLLMT